MSTRPPLQKMVGGVIPLNIPPVHEVKLMELLGTGIFSTVWKAIDTTTGTPYTLKILSGIKPGSVEAERVRLESSVAIPSEHIIAVVGLEEWEEGTFLILFEHFESVSLDKLIERNMLTDEQKRSVFLQILRGVAAAHRHNVIHRDLKPANILVNSKTWVKLIDFGISKFKCFPITKSGDIIGTVNYMAPELFQEDGASKADARCDIFSLGHILYELSMGEHFWTHKGLRELEDVARYMSSVSPVEAIDLSDFTCSFFPNTHAVLGRMVRIDPKERTKTVTEIQRALGDPLTEREIDADIDRRNPVLIIVSGENRQARLVLGLSDGEAREIGRYDLAGNDVSISRRHLEISRKGEKYYIRDLKSKNGTLLRGNSLRPDGALSEVQDGDYIKVGDIFLKFMFLSTKSHEEITA